MFRLIGVYDYTVILTYLSLISSACGMIQALHGDCKTAIFCLAFSGLCDGFDGRVARTKKNRTEDEKQFGIQLDSLCDVICFGVFPAMICYQLGVRGLFGVVLVCFYCMCAVCRLAFFNVLEGKRQQEEGGGNKAYRGLPVTSVSYVLPVVFWLQYLMSPSAFVVILHLVLLAVGFLFVLDFPLKKPTLKPTLMMIGVSVAIVAVIYVCTQL